MTNKQTVKTVFRIMRNIVRLQKTLSEGDSLYEHGNICNLWFAIRHNLKCELEIDLNRMSWYAGEYPKLVESLYSADSYNRYGVKDKYRNGAWLCDRTGNLVHYGLAVSRARRKAGKSTIWDLEENPF